MEQPQKKSSWIRCHLLYLLVVMLWRIPCIDSQIFCNFFDGLVLPSTFDCNADLAQINAFLAECNPSVPEPLQCGDPITNFTAGNVLHYPLLMATPTCDAATSLQNVVTRYRSSENATFGCLNIALYNGSIITVTSTDVCEDVVGSINAALAAYLPGTNMREREREVLFFYPYHSRCLFTSLFVSLCA